MSEEELHEDSDDGLLRTGWHGSDKGSGVGWAYRVPLGSAAKRSGRRCERRLRCGLESSKRRIGRRGRWRRCGCESRRRFDCRRAVDRGTEGTIALKPNRYDPHIGERARENECAAECSDLSVRDWDLRQPRRRNSDGGEQAWSGFPRQPGKRVGSRSIKGRGAGNPRSARTVWDYFGSRRWRAAEDDVAFQVWGGWPLG